jgi:hypothetical protein
VLSFGRQSSAYIFSKVLRPLVAHWRRNSIQVICMYCFAVLQASNFILYYTTCLFTCLNSKISLSLSLPLTATVNGFTTCGALDTSRTRPSEINSEIAFSKGRLKNSVHFWQKIGTSDFILNMIYEGYTIPLLHEPKSVFLNNNKSANVLTIEYSTVVAVVIRFGDVVMLEIFLLHERAVSGSYEMK